MLRKELPKMKRKVEASKDEPDAKKIKVDPAEEKQKEEMKKQNKRFDIDCFGEDFLLLPSQDVLLSRPDEEAHEEEGAGGLIGAQQTGDSCWRGGFSLNDVKRIILTEYVTCSDLW